MFAVSGNLEVGGGAVLARPRDKGEADVLAVTQKWREVTLGVAAVAEATAVVGSLTIMMRLEGTPLMLECCGKKYTLWSGLVNC